MRHAIALALSLAFALAGPPASARTPAPYLFTILENPAYRASWNALLASASPPPWLAEFSRTNNGVTGPAEFVTVNKRFYEIFLVCKPHDCADNKFAVMFERGGANARGVLATPRARMFFGNPDAAERRALVRALGK